jgi:glycosyltransferase involved in cell wall biosynthesis
MTPPKRPVLALVSDAIYPYNHGGKEQRYYEFAQRIADRAEVHVYTMHWWPGQRALVEQGVTFHAVSRLVPMYSKGCRRSMKQAIIFAFGCARLLLHRFDVLEADHMPYLQIPVLRAVTLLRRKRFVVTWHEVWGPAYWRQYLGPLGRVAWLIEWLAMRLPDHIIAASPQTAERLRSILGAHKAITVAPNGIDLAAVSSALPSAAASDIVVVSRLLPHKRIDMLLDVVALLHARGNSVTCRIIGDGPERLKLQQKAIADGIADAVDFRYDVQEQKDVYSLVKAARAFVFPSSREGFGIAVLEALACGVPVVTTSATDNLSRHLVARSPRGVVCAPSVEAMADAVSQLLSENGRYPSDPEPGSWLEEYSWESMVNRIGQALTI